MMEMMALDRLRRVFTGRYPSRSAAALYFSFAVRFRVFLGLGIRVMRLMRVHEGYESLGLIGL